MLDLVPPLADFLPASPGPYAALIVIGFLIGVLGGLTRLRWLIATGIALIVLGAILFPVGVGLLGNGGSSALEEAPFEEPAP